MFNDNNSKNGIETLVYQESGKVGTTGLLLSLVGYILITLFAGYAYSLIVIVFPLIYANLIVCVIFSVGLGLVVRLFTRLAKNRNRRNRIIQGFVLGFLMNYFQWITYITYSENLQIPDFSDYLSNLGMIFNPSDFFSSIYRINQIGLWSVFGMSFNGLNLTIVWLIEAALLIAGPTIAIYRTQVYPFSENTLKWFPKYTLFKDFESISSSVFLIDELSKDPILGLQGLQKGDGLRHTKVHVFYSQREDFGYLTFERIYYEGRGKGAKHADIVLNNFRLTRHQAEQILEIYENNRERIDVI